MAARSPLPTPRTSPGSIPTGRRSPATIGTRRSRAAWACSYRGSGLAESDAHGDPLDDDDLLLLLNAHHEAIPFVLPKPRLTHWVVLLDTAIGADAPSPEPLPFGAPYPLQGRSMAVLLQHAGRR